MITEEEKEFESLAEPVTLGTFVLIGDEFEMMLVSELVVFEMELVFFEGGTLHTGFLTKLFGHAGKN